MGGRGTRNPLSLLSLPSFSLSPPSLSHQYTQPTVQPTANSPARLGMNMPRKTRYSIKAVHGAAEKRKSGKRKSGKAEKNGKRGKRKKMEKKGIVIRNPALPNPSWFFLPSLSLSPYVVL